jgi:hypothetical protein
MEHVVIVSEGVMRQDVVLGIWMRLKIEDQVIVEDSRKRPQLSHEVAGSLSLEITLHSTILVSDNLLISLSHTIPNRLH